MSAPTSARPKRRLFALSRKPLKMKGRFPIPETVLSFRFKPEKPARSCFAVNFRPFCRANVSACEPGLPTIVRRQHSSKASCPIFVTDAGISIVRSEWHSSNALSPIYVTPAGTSIAPSESQSLKTFHPRNRRGPETHRSAQPPREVGIGSGFDFRQLTGDILDNCPLANTIMEYIARFFA